MPARMWKHGIHDFLEVLRHRLASSLDHMLAFLYIAYAMMALLYETIPSFEDTWVECLGDLGRYRMAIGDEDVKDRDVWCGVARFWYSKAADRNRQVSYLRERCQDGTLNFFIDRETTPPLGDSSSSFHYPAAQPVRSLFNGCQSI